MNDCVKQRHSLQTTFDISIFSMYQSITSMYTVESAKKLQSPQLCSELQYDIITTWLYYSLYREKQDAQLQQRDRAAGCIGFGQKWKTGTGRQYFTDIIGLSSTTVT